MTVALAAVIPTRNRAPLAVNAVRSLLDQDCDIEIYVSDNSPSPDAALRDFCLTDTRVHYLKPPHDLALGDHWDWAIRQAMESSRATHFTIHHDRKWSKRDAWCPLLTIAARRPDMLVTFGVDSITDTPPPLRVWQTPWTGNVFVMRTKRAAELIAHARVTEIVHGLPLLTNCIVPRSILESMMGRFGSVCCSTGPDLAFFARFLALHDQYLHADRSPGILYAPHRSNNMGYLRGIGGDFGEFRRLFGDGPWLDAAPIPGVNLGNNMLFHEYELARRETGDRLPPLDRAACLEDLAAALRWVEDPLAKERSLQLLRERGWNGSIPKPHPTRRWRTALRQNVWMFLGERLAIAPPHITGFAFRDDEEALRYALRFPRRRQRSTDHLALLDPEELSAA
ncbi:MAG: hypothetical protein QOE68_4670 [Thermoanaerobaculia bacterium]|jgi:hypothetical protein|nr:hypothetical protein [Thermoanaerobaculia bacterium]